MGKMATNRKIGGWLAMTSLAVALAAFGCTSNRYPGNGEPTRVTPSYGAVTPSLTPGSSSGTAGIPPMASSYTSSAGTPRINTDALATLAADQGFRGRVLGPIGAEGPQTGSGAPLSGQWVNPAMIVNPQQTVNASISSPANSVYANGTGGGADLFVAPATIGTAAATAAPLTVTGAIGVGALPANGTTVPATTAFSPTITGEAAFTPAMTNATMSGVAQPASAATAAAVGATSPLTVSGATGVGATPAAGTIVPSTTLFSPTVSGGLISTPVVTTPAGAARTSTRFQRSTVRAAQVRPAHSSKTATAKLVISSLSPVRVVTRTNGQVLITNLKK